MERRFLVEGRLVRPFSLAAKVCCRGCSSPLERRMVDFGVDKSFAKASGKLEEHYGITMPESRVRTVTQKHAHEIREREDLRTQIPEYEGVGQLIAEIDGTMIPIVDTDDETETGDVDRRKTRKTRYAEARLAMAYEDGSVSPVFGATMDDAQEAGDRLAHCAVCAGVGLSTAVHCVGDGAAWIANQVDRIFGLHGTYLIDFYHLCEYVEAASKSCGGDNPPDWTEEQKRLLKENEVERVLANLEPHIEPKSLSDENAPVRRCHRYITNRPGQFNYKDAIASDLPIGSGQIESAHRYVIHERLDIAGAWWKEDNANDMLALRALRQNGYWEDYWKRPEIIQTIF
ncbi:MAG: ISKra4 family transposase [Proteobacteria bacterium]|nr:ISKra4 family transposase [Pseudomonadota bacterium]